MRREDSRARGGSSDEFDEAAHAALARFDGLNQRIVADREIVLACREGCSLCCWLRVDVFAHEVFLLAHHIRRHYTPEGLAELMVRLRTHAAKVQPLTAFEHATQNVVCPLLQEGRCSVYAARPHSCRRQHATDFAACQFTFDHPWDLEAPAAHDRELFRTLTEAMCENIEEYARLDYDSTFYELGSALHEALSDPASWQRWQDRQQAFLTASITPSA